MGRFLRISRPVLIIGMLALPGTAKGDVIHIVSGALVSNSPEPVFVNVTMASPDHGFSLTAVPDTYGGIFDPFFGCLLGPECVPGHSVSLRAAWSGSDLIGTATADGLTFPVGLGSETTGYADVNFTGTFTPPPFTGSTTTSVIAPFTFIGVMGYPHSPNEPGPFPRFEDTLVGSGFATINLSWGSGNAGAWTYTGSRYEFSATPEPGTLLLIAPFALGLARRQAVRRAARS